MLMTRNVLTALEAGEFDDPAWVQTLLRHFAGYSFAVLARYDQCSPATPEVWPITDDATRDPDTLILQNLLLGVNATSTTIWS